MGGTCEQRVVMCEGGKNGETEEERGLKVGKKVEVRHLRIRREKKGQNILDKFNPGARQMINAGKQYLKALHAAATASRLYVEAITKLARQSQQGTWGGSSDIVTTPSHPLLCSEEEKRRLHLALQITKPNQFGEEIHSINARGCGG
ncbi:hypothetical protein LSTR_LSTR005385 [Laodelphax striatellus]|uniref:IMD domain-containing protein n=1 Tax=Laodelphax striatellus TaxID=195883 RepID=A0A482WRU4_LAOST|nr:hypothetical protein LSTR_LSTR005385 [Laodelphax striatellus]